MLNILINRIVRQQATGVHCLGPPILQRNLRFPIQRPARTTDRPNSAGEVDGIFDLVVSRDWASDIVDVVT